MRLISFLNQLLSSDGVYWWFVTDGVMGSVQIQDACCIYFSGHSKSNCQIAVVVLLTIFRAWFDFPFQAAWSTRSQEYEWPCNTRGQHYLIAILKTSLLIFMVCKQPWIIHFTFVKYRKGYFGALRTHRRLQHICNFELCATFHEVVYHNWRFWHRTAFKNKWFKRRIFGKVLHFRENC